MKNINNIVLLGHGVGIKIVIDTITQNFNNFKIACIITHPRTDHKNDFDLIKKRKDLYKDYAYNVFNAKKDYNIDVFESKNVNDESNVNLIKEYNPSYIISVGCRNIIKDNFLSVFNKKVLNIHTTPLPKYRGAATDSWMILNNEHDKRLFGTIHYIAQGIDTGNIIAKHPYKFPKFSYPIDVFKIRMNTIRPLLIKAINNLKDKNFKAEIQNQNSSSSFPRLYTPNDGRINFERFNGNEIELFIYAFGYPFQGAHCFIDDKKINIMECEFIKDKGFHSYSWGLIYGKNNLNQYKVSVNGGYILIKKIEFNGSFIENNKMFKIGRYLK